MLLWSGFSRESSKMLDDPHWSLRSVLHRIRGPDHWCDVPAHDHRVRLLATSGKAPEDCRYWAEQAAADGKNRPHGPEFRNLPPAKLEKVAMSIDDTVAKLPAQMMSRSGSLFYSGRAAFRGTRDLYILGLNPGGSPITQADETIARDLADWRDLPEHWSAYLDESWQGRQPGTHGMQPRMRHMFNQLGRDLAPCRRAMSCSCDHRPRPSFRRRRRPCLRNAGLCIMP